MRLGTQTITRLRGVNSTDEYHNDTVDWTTPTTVDIPGCSVQPFPGLQVIDQREAITTLYSVWAPVDADVVDTDRVQWAGKVYDIDGSVQRWQVGSTLDHLLIQLKAVSG